MTWKMYQLSLCLKNFSPTYKSVQLTLEQYGFELQRDHIYMDIFFTKYML